MSLHKLECLAWHRDLLGERGKDIIAYPILCRRLGLPWPYSLDPIFFLLLQVRRDGFRVKHVRGKRSLLLKH